MKQLFCKWAILNENYFKFGFEELSRKYISNYNLTKITDNLLLNICTFMIKYHSFIIK